MKNRLVEFQAEITRADGSQFKVIQQCLESPTRMGDVLASVQFFGPLLGDDSVDDGMLVRFPGAEFPFVVKSGEAFTIKLVKL